MNRIEVNVSKKYDILIEFGILKDVGRRIKEYVDTSNLIIVSDDIVYNKYGNILEESLGKEGFKFNSFVFKNGEQSKNIKTLSDILEFFASNGIKRRDCVIALGGGVVGDITGLAAALYMRGISIIQIPTTLISMVDSSIGGKTAIDLKSGKNLAGAFWQPLVVLCDPQIICDLPDDLFSEGMGEVIKCNEIRDLNILSFIEKDSVKENIEEIIIECLTLKRDIVEMDELDVKGIRNKLNVGHTVAHSIEKCSEYTIPHGFAVGTGIILEAKISKKLGICQQNLVERLEFAVNKYGLLLDLPYSKEILIENMKNDKKNNDARIVFELPKTFGQIEEVKLSVKELENLL